MDIVRYKNVREYLIEKFGTRTLKICVDGGFTCPNRDGTKGYGGCIFCGSEGAGENIKCKSLNSLTSIENQITNFLSSYRGDRAEKFVVYFQAFSGTYASVDTLKKIYDTALSVSDKIVGLEIATRPDLITEDICKLLAGYLKDYYVCVELGLQTASDSVGEVINRKYTTSDFVRATKMLTENNISVVAHLMVGLPGETEKDILNTVEVINNSGAKGIKIHNTYVLKNTVLENMYLSGKYQTITQEYYVEMVSKIISRLRPDIVIHRITGDPPKSTFVAPDWATHKKILINAINKKLKEKNITQGQSYRSRI